LRQWDVATGKELRAFTLPSRRLVVQIAFSPDGRLLAAMHADQTVSLYETASGRERTLLGKPKPSQLVSAWIYQRRYEPPPVRVLAFSPDGKLLLSRSPVDIIRAWDVHAAVEIAQFPGHDGAVLAVAFAPDRRSFVTGGNDTTILRWDVQRLKRAAALPVTRVEPGEIESLWGDLAGEDAVKAFASMRKMVSAPTEAVAFLRQQLKPVVAFERVDQLVANLDSGDFRTRTQAAKELESLGESALSALKKAHVSASLEARRRIEPLLEKLTPNALTTEQVRLVRSVEVLERIGSAEARQVLGALANGAPDALLTRQARAVLNRHSGP
jgi:hypothetical protein